MTSFQTFETTGTVDENGVLQVEPFVVGAPPGQVRLSVALATSPLDYDDSEPTPQELAAMSMTTFADWADPAEDIYSVEDGKPYNPHEE